MQYITNHNLFKNTLENDALWYSQAYDLDIDDREVWMGKLIIYH